MKLWNHLRTRYGLSMLPLQSALKGLWALWREVALYPYGNREAK